MRARTLLGVVIATGALAAPAVGETWQVQSIPTPGPGGLAGLSCPSSTTCIGVGDYAKSGQELTLAELWNGQEWSVLRTPNPQGVPQSVLSAVSCSRQRHAWLLAPFTAATLRARAPRWQNSGMAISGQSKLLRCPPCRSTHITLPRMLSSLECLVRLRRCALGLANGPTGRSGKRDCWRNGGMAIRGQSNAPSAGVALRAVCAPASDCTAVGQRKHPLVERWNGKSWGTQLTPPGVGGDLSAVSCLLPTFCAAVGGRHILGRNGSGWSSEKTSLSGGGIHLDGISCVSASWCIAVGAGGGGGALAVTPQNGVYRESTRTRPSLHRIHLLPRYRACQRQWMRHGWVD